MPLSSLNLQALIFKEQIRFLYGHAMGSYWGSFLLSMLMVILIWEDINRSFLIYWMIAVSCLFLFRIFIHLKWQLGSDVLPPELRAKIFTYGAILSGALWGIAGWVIYDPNNEFNTIMIMILLNGMAGGVVISLSSHSPAYFGFTLGCILPVMAKMIFLGGSHNLGLLLLEFLSFLFLFSWHKKTHQNLYQLFKLQIENTELIKKVQTESELTKQALLQTEKISDEKSTFIAAASHDLRQPLFAIQLNAYKLGNRNLTDSAFDECLDGIHQDVATLTNMFNDLLDVSKLDSGMMQPIYSSIDSPKLLKQIVEEFKRTHPNRTIRVATNVDNWCTDAVFIKRILQNLVGNALKFSSNNVLIVLKQRQQKFSLKVYDQGIGIQPADVAHIFEEYYQVGNKGRDRKQGFGIGLSIVKRLVDTLNGTIAVHSVYGKGTTFKIELPQIECKSPHPPTHNHKELVLSPAQLEALKLLIVDDDQTILELLECFWADLGVQVYTAKSFDEAKAQMNKYTFDVVISDYRLNDASGFELMSYLKTHSAKSSASLKFILTGDTTLGLAEQLDDVTILYKPISPETLLSAVQSEYIQRSGASV